MEKETPAVVQKGMTKAELTDFIVQEMNKTLPGAVEKAVSDQTAPLAEQQSQWFEKIKATGNQKDVMDKGTKGIGAGRIIRSLAAGRGDVDRAVAFAKKAWSDDLGDVIVKSLQAGDFTAGGALIPQALSGEVIELLRARSVVRAAGARVLPMPRGTLSIRRQTGTTTATYIGESKDISKTEPTVGQLNFTAKKLAAIVPISNDLLVYDADVSADAFVRDDLVQMLARREDQAFLRDDGTSDKPKGLRYWAVSGNITATNGTSTVNIEDDFKNLINALELANVGMTKPVWLMSPRSKNHLLNLRTTQGALIFPELRATNSIYGWPVYTTTHIPTNLSTNQTELYLVDMNEVIIAESTSLEIAVDSSASYIDGSSLVSAFSRDETLMRAIMRHDFGVRHQEAIAIKTGVAWGA